MSAYEYVNGAFDYNSLPLAPLGCALQMHEAAARRKTWDPHALSGWYIGTSIEHYRCHRVFCTKTRSERVSDTVIFQHRHITSLTLMAEDTIVKAIGDVKSILLKRQNTISNIERRAIKKLQAIFMARTDIPVKKVQFSDLTALPTDAGARTAAPIELALP